MAPVEDNFKKNVLCMPLMHILIYNIYIKECSGSLGRILDWGWKGC